MWFGTDGDLIRFDGYDFTIFSPDPMNAHSLASNTAGHLCEDGKGNIWITGDLGLSCYNVHTGIITRYKHADTTNFLLQTNNESCMVADQRGTVWIASNGLGLFYFDDASGQFTPLRNIIKDTLSNRNIKCLMVDRKGLIWIGTNDGINIYDPVQKKLSVFNPAEGNNIPIKTEVTCILEDHMGEIWYSSYNKGLYRYNPATGSVKCYRYSDKDPSSLGTNLVNTMMEDRNHNIWVGGFEGGLSIYHPSTDNFSIYRAHTQELNALGSDQIMKIFQDRSGVVWIGTDAGGLFTSYPENKKIRVFQNWEKEYLSYQPLSLYKDRTGRIFMTTLVAGIKEFDPATEKFKPYKISEPNHVLNAANSSYGLLEASDGKFWGIGYDESLFTMDRGSGKFTILHSKSGSRDSADHNIFYCIAEDLDKRLWIGSNNGLKYYDLRNKSMSSFEKLYPDTNLLSSDIIVSLYCDKNATLWIGGTKSGLTLLNTKTGSIKIFKSGDSNAHSISSNTINCFYAEENTRTGTAAKIWIGTNGGLNEFDLNTEQFTAYTMHNGLPANAVKSILADDQGHLWLTTGKGICRFTPPASAGRKAECRNYNTGDELPGDEFYFNAVVKANDGTLFFASQSGLISFKPDDLKDNNFVPPVLITDFSVFNKSVSPGDSSGILKIPVEQTREITLSYQQNVFGFTFSALSYIHPEKNQYAYKLEGFDKDWIYTDAKKICRVYQSRCWRIYI